MNKRLLLSLLLCAGMANSYAQQVTQKKNTPPKNNTKINQKKVDNKQAPIPAGSHNKTLDNFMLDSNVFDSNIEIRIVESFELMGSCKEGMQARHDIEKKQEVLGQEIKQEEQKITQKMNEYRGKHSVLTEPARENEEKNLMKMERDFKNKIQETQDELKRDMDKKTINLARSMNDAAAQVAKKEKLDLVIDKDTGRVVYCSERLNLTAKVKRGMDQQYERKLAQNKKESRSIDGLTRMQDNRVDTVTV